MMVFAAPRHERRRKLLKAGLRAKALIGGLSIPAPCTSRSGTTRQICLEEIQLLAVLPRVLRSESLAL